MRKKKQYLPGIADGSLRLQAFGVTEPTSGTDTTALRTTAKKSGDHYIVNGQKIWTSRAEHSDLLLLLARTTPREEVVKKTDGLSVFLVDMRNFVGKSLRIRPIRTMMNHSTTELFFDDMKKASKHINNIWSDPNIWWKSSKVQIALVKFKKEAFNVRENWIEEWSNHINTQSQ